MRTESKTLAVVDNFHWSGSWYVTDTFPRFTVPVRSLSCYNLPSGCFPKIFRLTSISCINVTSSEIKIYCWFSLHFRTKTTCRWTMVWATIEECPWLEINVVALLLHWSTRGWISTGWIAVTGRGRVFPNLIEKWKLRNDNRILAGICQRAGPDHAHSAVQSFGPVSDQTWKQKPPKAWKNKMQILPKFSVET